MLSFATLLTALALLPSPTVTEDRCDVVEVQTVLHAIEGDLWNKQEVREGLRQIIFWTHGPNGYHVRDWRLDKGQFWHAPGEISWTESGRMFRVRYRELRITHSLDDSEVLDREDVPNEQRVKLGGSK